MIKKSTRAYACNFPSWWICLKLFPSTVPYPPFPVHRFLSRHHVFSIEYTGNDGWVYKTPSDGHRHTAPQRTVIGWKLCSSANSFSCNIVKAFKKLLIPIFLEMQAFLLLLNARHRPCYLKDEQFHSSHFFWSLQLLPSQWNQIPHFINSEHHSSMSI